MPSTNISSEKTKKTTKIRHRKGVSTSLKHQKLEEKAKKDKKHDLNKNYSKSKSYRSYRDNSKKHRTHFRRSSKKRSKTISSSYSYSSSYSSYSSSSSSSSSDSEYEANLKIENKKKKLKEKQQKELKKQKELEKAQIKKTEIPMVPFETNQMSLQDQIMHQAMITTNPSVTRLARRIYVGNLPTGLGLTEKILLEYFCVYLKYVGVATPQPLLSLWLSEPPSFCLLEMRSVYDTDKCIGLLENITINGHKLKIGRPPDYQPSAPNLHNYVVGAVPFGFNSKHIVTDPAAHKTKKHTGAAQKKSSKFIVSFPQYIGTRIKEELVPVKIKPTIDGGTTVSAAFEEDAKGLKEASLTRKKQEELFLDADDKVRRALLTSLPKMAEIAPTLLDIEITPSKPCPPSLVLVVENMVHPPDVKDDQMYFDIMYDIREGAKRYGELGSVVIPRPGKAPGEFGVGKVFIEFKNVKSAMMAKKYLPRRRFMNRTLTAKYYPEYKFKAYIF